MNRNMPITGPSDKIVVNISELAIYRTRGASQGVSKSNTVSVAIRM